MVKALCLLILLGFGSTAAFAASDPIKLRGIKGKDDRILIERYQYPWSAVGRLNKRGAGFCTGTLIAPRLVLTAAHCLWNKKRGRWMHPSDVFFLAGYRRGDYIDTSPAKKLHPNPAYKPKDNKTLKMAANDWAIVELKKDFSQKTGTIPVLAMDEPLFKTLKDQNTNFLQAGYSQDKKHILTVNTQCPMQTYVSKHNVVKHQCDAVNGDSGSPIFSQQGGKTKIAAIHVATTQKGKAEGVAISGISIANFLKKRGLWKQTTQILKPKPSKKS